MALARDILRKIVEAAGVGYEVSGKRVAYVKVQLGASRFTHMEELKELLTEVSKGTIVEGAKIEFVISPVKSACADCGTEFKPGKKMSFACEKCGSSNIQLTSGNELVIKEIR
ncbi:MAG: hydrogenase maturation nickel metallochaperone HypA [Candidatus Margulisbacteria bacterium]|nr:hydrogenase maturation nickel metallochaperone HypA [Candidatus Margulisiibacteriota bacterium]